MTPSFRVPYWPIGIINNLNVVSLVLHVFLNVFLNVFLEK